MKFELKKKHINYLMKQYDTYRAYRGEFIEENKAYTKVEFQRRDKKGMLTINLETDINDESQYVMVNLVNSYGRIVRKDRYGFFVDGNNLYFDCSDNLLNDTESTEFIPFNFEDDAIQSQKKHTRDNTIQLLRMELAEHKEKFKLLQDENKRLKEENDTLTHSIEEKDREIKQMQEKSSANPTRSQQIFNDAVRMRDFYKKSYEKESNKCKELSEEIENLKIQMCIPCTTENDSIITIRDKASEIFHGRTWTESYDVMEKPELIKRLRYTETISDKRAEKIKELKKELNSKKYDKYVQEDAVTYNEAILRMNEAIGRERQSYDYLKQSNEDRDRLKKEIERLTARSGEVNGLEIIKESIENENKIRAAQKKKPGRKEKFDESKIALMIELKKQGYTMREIAREIGCSAATVCQKIKQYGE